MRCCKDTCCRSICAHEVSCFWLCSCRDCIEDSEGQTCYSGLHMNYQLSLLKTFLYYSSLRPSMRLPLQSIPEVSKPNLVDIDESTNWKLGLELQLNGANHLVRPLLLLLLLPRRCSRRRSGAVHKPPA